LDKLHKYDVFICHASEDKDAIARPLAEALKKKGLKVWYDEFELNLGDSLSGKIDYGLANSQYGVVIVSKNFFGKKWAKKELGGLVARATVIFPIWHGVDAEYVKHYSPTLADTIAVSTREGVDTVANRIFQAIFKVGRAPYLSDSLLRILPAISEISRMQDTVVDDRSVIDRLETATGRSEFVIAASIDIRGFSSFSMSVESSELAMFLKTVYRKIINEYFPKACFFKPTGDGLLIVTAYTQENLKKVVANTISASLELLRDFSSFCDREPTMYFKSRVPRKLGIGLSRGVVLRLVSDDKTLDYSGRALNLASRLMDLARPSGIVFDANFGIELLSDELKQHFSKDSIYLHGIAETEPIEIYYTKDLTQISLLNMQPLEKIKWKVVAIDRKLKQIRNLARVLAYGLPSEPKDADKIRISASIPSVKDGRRIRGVTETVPLSKFAYQLKAGKPEVQIKFDALAEILERRGVKDNWKVKIEIMYPEK